VPKPKRFIGAIVLQAAIHRYGMLQTTRGMGYYNISFNVNLQQ
jgi:hypothetical protein